MTTNLERIRQMNSEELAELLFSKCENFCVGNRCGFGCLDGIIQ